MLVITLERVLSAYYLWPEGDFTIILMKILQSSSLYSPLPFGLINCYSVDLSAKKFGWVLFYLSI